MAAYPLRFADAMSVCFRVLRLPLCGKELVNGCLSVVFCRCHECVLWDH
jgi:hypothetical protein